MGPRIPGQKVFKYFYLFWCLTSAQSYSCLGIIHVLWLDLKTYLASKRAHSYFLLNVSRYTKLEINPHFKFGPFAIFVLPLVCYAFYFACEFSRDLLVWAFGIMAFYPMASSMHGCPRGTDCRSSLWRLPPFDFPCWTVQREHYFFPLRTLHFHKRSSMWQIAAIMRLQVHTFRFSKKRKMTLDK